MALVGDASGYVDAITGEGLALAFHQAFSLVEAIEAGNLGLYARAHRRHRRLPDAMTRALLFAERRPWLRRRAIAALAADPPLFRLLLGVHARTHPPSAVGFRGALRLAWGLTGLSRRKAEVRGWKEFLSDQTMTLPEEFELGEDPPAHERDLF